MNAITQGEKIISHDTILHLGAFMNTKLNKTYAKFTPEQ